MPELRKNPVNDEWVIIATERSKRPSDFAKGGQEKKAGGGNCPFCVGNEKETPPEVFALREEGTSPDTPGWKVRVIPNKFAALSPEGELALKEEGLSQWANGVGAHEVIIESTDHDSSLAQEDEEQVERIVKAWHQRYLALGKDPRLKYTQIFKNVGKIAGASLEHPHSQLISLPLPPRTVAQEMEGAQAYYDQHHRCVYCDLIRSEAEAGRRVIFQSDDFIAFCPYASRFPFEIWLLPWNHHENFSQAQEQHLRSLGLALKSSLGKLEDSLEDPPLNLVLHTAPYGQEGGPAYHWHIEILPRLTTVAGFEWGTGFYINPTPPEDAAKYLN